MFKSISYKIQKMIVDIVISLDSLQSYLNTTMIYSKHCSIDLLHISNMYLVHHLNFVK